MKEFFKKSYLPFIRLSKVLSRKGIYPFLEKEFSTIQAGSMVLIIGAGGEVGELLNRYSELKKYQVISFDIDSKHQPDLTGDICRYDFGSHKYDVVVVSEVLEHLHSPSKAISNKYI